MKAIAITTTLAAVCCMMLGTSCASKQETKSSELITVGNPYLPLWEHIPDGEPYVFEDPDQPGKKRVYIYGSHDDLITMYCGRDQVVWSAPVEVVGSRRGSESLALRRHHPRGGQERQR